MDRRQREFPGNYTVKRAGNRRAYPRWAAQFEVRYTFEQKLLSGTPGEMAEGGLSFLTDEAPPEGTELEIEYRFPPEERWVKVKAVVRHVRKNHVGVEF